jgi:hypothetical protein
LRRFAGVNEPPLGGEWEPAAETLSAFCEGSLDAISLQRISANRG